MKKQCLFVDLGINFLGKLKGLHHGGYVPYGLLCVVSHTVNQGYPSRVMMMDHVIKEPFTGTTEELDRITCDAIEAEIKSIKPRVFALGMPYTFQYKYMLRIMEMVKKMDPTILTLVGGAHTSVLDKNCFKDSDHIDVVVRGEGEETMVHLLKTFNQKKDFEEVPGITYRKNGEVLKTRRREFLDLSTMPMVDFKLLPKDFYENRGINISPNRGCEWTCRFCEEQIFWGNTVRSIPEERVAEEVKSILKNKYKYTFINLEDSMLDLRSDRFLRLAKKLADIKNKRLGYCVTRVDSVSETGLEAARRMGLFAILFGVESASEIVLDSVNKGLTLEKVKNTLRLSRSKGIYNGTLWVVGLPKDTPQESQKSYDFLEMLYCEDLTDIAAISRLVPYPGTPIFGNPDLYKVKILHYDWERWVRFTKEGCCENEGFSNEQIHNSYEKIFTMARTMEFEKQKALKITDIIRY